MSQHQITAVDWMHVLWDLVQREHNLLTIQRKTGIAEGTLREYMKGSQPPHWRGELLLELWCSVCATARQDVPMTQIALMPRIVRPAPQVAEQQSAAMGLEMWSRAPLLDRLKEAAK